MEKYMMVLAVFADLFIGDPRTKLHPVVLMGNFIAWMEKHLLKESDSPSQKRKKGVVLVCLVVSVIYTIAVAAAIGLLAMGPWWFFFGSILILVFMIAPRSLAEAGVEIKQYLADGDLVHARERVGWVVGRDTDKMDEQEVTRAAVETIAENIVDGVISPLFYFFLGGFPLAVMYRAVNTMDSMIAYENEKYIDFGYAAAKMDDVFNYIPARITALLLIIASFILRYDGKKAAEIVHRDADKHPSPNGGYPESAVAGALRIRLGGTNYYDGETHFREYMGDALEPIAPHHIDKTMRLLYVSTILFCLIGIGIEMAGQTGGTL